MELTDTRFLVEWLTSNDVLRILLGQNVHQELLQRADQIYIFLAKQEKLNEQQLEALWEACWVSTHVISY